MCEPTTIIMAAGLVVSAYMAYDAGQTQKEFAEYEAKQAEADARTEAGVAEVEAARIRKAAAFARAEAAAGAAVSGINVGSGTSLAINRDITERAEEDAFLTIAGGADRAARGRADASLSRARGRAAARAGQLGAASQGLKAAGTAYTGWKTHQQGAGGAT